jgi:hypothetical protein
VSRCLEQMAFRIRDGTGDFRRISSPTPHPHGQREAGARLPLFTIRSCRGTVRASWVRADPEAICPLFHDKEGVSGCASRRGGVNSPLKTFRRVGETERQPGQGLS